MPNNLMHAFQGPAAHVRDSLVYITARAGKISDVIACADIGNIGSMASSSAQIINHDLPGSLTALSFFRGATSGVDASDPTFNGTAGALTENEYLSFDGGDWLADTTGTWLSATHKDGGEVTMLAWMYFNTTTGSQMICSNTTGGNPGFEWSLGSTNLLSFNTFDDTTNEITITSEATVSEDAWHVLGITFDEGTGNHYFFIDATQDDETATAASPTANNVEDGLTLGARSSGLAALESGARMGGFLVLDVAMEPEWMNWMVMFMRPRYGI